MCSESSPGAFRDSQEWYVALQYIQRYYKAYYSTLAVFPLLSFVSWLPVIGLAIAIILF